jgi:hypothetical protein
MESYLVSRFKVNTGSNKNPVQVPLLIGTALDENIHIEGVFCGVFIVGTLGKD